MLQGFRPDEPRLAQDDINFGDNCLHFVLQSISGASKSTTENEAADGLLKECRGCKFGDHSSYTDWRCV